jgi:23S rRNA pseudouridine1911/1915/1917 synthase
VPFAVFERDTATRLMNGPEPLAILYEDDHILAVVKPAGLLTQARRPDLPTLEDRVRRYLRPGDLAPVYLGTVHRLDRPVSGVVLWARTPRAAKRLSDQFEARTITKEYWAVVEPLTTPPAPGTEGIWDDHLARSSDGHGVVAILEEGAPGARRAVTRFRRDSDDGTAPFLVPEGLAGLRLWPQTGRTHQLRAQAGHRGLPIWGDAAYGALRAFPLGIALHARSLTLWHPALHQPLCVIAPLPTTWTEAGVTVPGA